ncbi:MAG: MmcB family DNA repair protein [Hyphomicrobiales bacterium]|nr:MmcB family DNA repair protein [Hyphomicrobiales bacterium]MCP5370201.1 MmcB family DNA repair protein [Hyphomicrobiales bacterium]
MNMPLFATAAGARPETTLRVTRGVCRLLRDLGYSPLTEFPLKNKRRVDVIGLNRGGRFLVAEVKSSPEDLRADGKWRDYLDFCDEFYFAVPDGFPLDLLPGEGCGILVADAFQGAVLRPAPVRAMNGTRRKTQILRYARRAANRLHGVYDPAD